MANHAVVVAGAGPIGLMLAGELKLAGVDVAIVERRLDQNVVGTRSRVINARTIEVLDQRGIAERFLAEGKAMQVGGFGGSPLDISDLPTRHAYGLALLQNDFEHILARWIDELAVPIYRDRTVTGFTQNETFIDIAISDGSSIHAAYLVGCDGGRSAIRKLAGIAFPGTDPTVSNIIAEGDLATEPNGACGSTILASMASASCPMVAPASFSPRPLRTSPANRRMMISSRP